MGKNGIFVVSRDEMLDILLGDQEKDPIRRSAEYWLKLDIFPESNPCNEHRLVEVMSKVANNAIDRYYPYLNPVYRADLIHHSLEKILKFYNMFNPDRGTDPRIYLFTIMKSAWAGELHRRNRPLRSNSETYQI